MIKRVLVGITVVGSLAGAFTAGVLYDRHAPGAPVAVDPCRVDRYVVHTENPNWYVLYDVEKGTELPPMVTELNAAIVEYTYNRDWRKAEGCPT